MEKRRAFTLVELLVVIAIIAVLMSILMPSLRSARRQAKIVVCQSNLRQWGAVFSMYTNNNDGYFWPGYVIEDQVPENMWMEATRAYYKDPELRVCPETKKPLWNADKSFNGLLGDPHLMWGIWPSSSAWYTKGDYGSYGANSWLNNPPLGIKVIWKWRTKFNWRNMNVNGGNNIPVFLDSWWVSGFPAHIGVGGQPPEFPGDIGVTGNEMGRFCIDRHGGGIVNTLFLDYSVRRVGLKELWTLKWSRGFDTNGPWTIAGFGGNASACASAWDAAALWMKDFPEY